MQLMNHLRRFYSFFMPREIRSSLMNDQRNAREETDDEEFNYPTTRCLSTYYSIFVARLAIMVMLAILISMLTILTWHFTKVYTTNSINSLAYGLRYQLLQRPVLRMWNILNSTVEITMAQVKLSEYVVGRYDSSISQDEQIELYQMMRDITWALFASRKALNAITISYRNGFVQAFHRDNRSNTTFYIYSELVNSTDIKNRRGQAHNKQIPMSRDGNVSDIWYREPLNPVTGEKMGDRREIPPDDLINIAGLSQVRDGAASWHVAVSKFTDSPLLSAALPVRHPTEGSIVAAVGVTTALKSVGQLMKELVGFHSGYMYLATREGYVLATSTDAPLLRNTTTGLELVRVNNSDDHMIRSGAEWLQRAYGDQFPISHEVHDDNAKLGKKRYYIDSFFLNLKRLPLVGVIIIPRKYIMGKVDQIAFTTLVILISASMCILAIGCVCIFILTSGVSKAMKLRAELISHLDARRRAEASSNYKSQFLANMSHELRTPMAAVIGLLDILVDDGCLTNEQFATITQIRKCSTALLRLLNNILDLSKVESGKLVLEEAEFDLGRELEGLVDMFSVQCINHNVEIVLDLSDDLPRMVKGDSARVVQIFTNLISNSIKFTSEGHIIVRGWCESFKDTSAPKQSDNEKMLQCTPKRRSTQDENSVKRDYRFKNKAILWFEIEDTGCGIDPSKWESVFESFEQADPSTTRKHGGTGLGLCIVRNLINKMGGEIKVAKKDSPGTLMQLYLVLQIPEGGTEKLVQADFSKHSLMVLLALKGSTNRSITSQWLRRNGIYTCETADWNGLTRILQQFFKGNTTVEGILEECATSLESNRLTSASKQLKDQDIICSSIIIVVDTSLLDQSTNIWSEQLIFLDRYRKRAKFAWVLSHDTSNAIKLELRQRGHFLTVNKPLYRTKMIQILENFINGERSGDSTMAEDLHECHELDPIQFEDVSSDEFSDIENSESINNPVSYGGKTRELISTSHPPHHQTSDTIKDLTHGVARMSIPQNSHLSLADEKVPNLSKDFTVAVNCQINKLDHSKCSVENESIKQEKVIATTEKLHKPYVAIGPPEKHNNAFMEMNQLHSGEAYIAEKEYQYCSNSTLFKKENSKHKLAEIQIVSASGLPPNVEMKKDYSSDRLINPFDRSHNLNYHYDNSRRSTATSRKMAPNQGTLNGLYILLAEDNPILQRVAATMLEKVGATVLTVGDGLQAVNELKCMFSAEDDRKQSSFHQESTINELKQMQQDPPFDLILMDCQMPKLDGYEATKAIRRLEAGTGSHIPIVAVTAHAMSSDEAKCLEVGMDAYLTKPIDCNLMVSTIISLTQRKS